MSDKKYMCALTFVDENNNPIQLSSYNYLRVKYAYFKDNVWTNATDYNIDYDLNILWVRLPEQSYENKFVINIAVGAEQILTSGVKDVEWTNLPNSNIYKLTLQGVLDEDHLGFSPRVIDGFWFEYSQEFGGLYNTGIKASATVSEGSLEVIDEAIQGEMKPITSNAVYNVRSDLNAIYKGLDNKINTTNSNLNLLKEDVNVLKDKNYSVKLNGETTEADQNGLIDLGEITPPEVEKPILVDGLTEIDGVIIPRGSTYYESDNTIASTSSPDYFYRVGLNKPNWVSLGDLNSSCEIKVKLIVYQSVYEGTIYVEKNAYNWQAVSTSKYIANNFFLYQTGYSCRLVCEGNMYILKNANVESNIQLTNVGVEIINFDESKLKPIGTFISNKEEDFITIEGSIYEVDPVELYTTKFIVKESVLFKFTTDLTYPVSLDFSVLNNDTTITVTDGVFTSSLTADAGELATFVFTDKNNFYWNTQRETDYELVSNKVQVLSDSEVEYPSCKAVKDAISGGGGSQLAKEIRFTIYSGQTIELKDSGKYYITQSFGGSSYVDLRKITEIGTVIEIDNLTGNSFNIWYDKDQGPFDMTSNKFCRCILTPTGWKIGFGSYLEWF